MSEPMIRKVPCLWEYAETVVPVNLTKIDYLNRIGRDGWELCSIDRDIIDALTGAKGYVCILKRPIRPDPPTYENGLPVNSEII